MDAARAGRTVAVVSSGDAGVYGMAGLLLEVCGDDPAIEVEVIPGVTAACAGGAALGAPPTRALWCVAPPRLLPPKRTFRNKIGVYAAAFPVYLHPAQLQPAAKFLAAAIIYNFT